MKKIILSAIIGILVVSAAAAAAEKKAALPKKEAPAAAKKPKPIEAMTKEEVSQQIKDLLNAEPEALDAFPNVKRQKSDDGAASYTYQGVRMEEISREMLVKLLGRVRSEVVRARTERLNRQVRTITQAGKMGGAGQRIPAVFTPPTPPRIPRPPPAPPQIPRTPPPPSAPTRR